MYCEVVVPDPWPHVFSVNALLNLVQRFGREHLIETDIVAEVHEKNILTLRFQDQNSVRKDTGIP